MMRIITGTARGAKLQAPVGEHTRPTAERTKEAVFSMLQQGFLGRRVLDLFGGSGQLGLEAVSRGAKSAVIVDSDRAAIRAITENAKHTKLEQKVEVHMAESLSFLRSYRGEPFHLIFLDPPYHLGLVPKCLDLILERNLITEGGIIVCETASPDDVSLSNVALDKKFEVLRRARYGVAHVTLLTPKKESVALLPGSYDPITLGHLDIIERACAEYDHVVVAVMNNAAKEYMFSMSERTEMASLATKDMPTVRVVSDEGMLVDLFDRLGATVIVKGVRNPRDLAYEEEMAAYNLKRNPKAQTLFLPSDPRFLTLSSTCVREELGRGAVPTDLLPESVAQYLAARGMQSK